jgi:predicted Ser/Thr protein kinase/outer membrane lipoprotein-sorting protein
MAETKRCAQCGQAIPTDTPEGLCPNCLLKVSLPADAGSQPASSAAGSEPVATSSYSGRFVPPQPAELAPHFPQLEILELLGQGGMGAVYKARQPGLDRPVALKVLPREIGSDSAFAERFTREARALARLSHPHVVGVYDFGRTGDGQFYFVMEYVDGVNLRQAIQSGGMSPQQALAIVPQICDALQFAHDEGIVHRDIKPENILIDKKGRVKIADFGLAKLLGRAATDVSLTGTQQVMGTLRYMAPEQLEGSKAVDHRADIYSLGVVFYELLTGELPIGRFAAPSKKVQIDVRLDEVVLRALEKEPEQRYQHAGEVKTDVENITTTGRRGGVPAFGIPAAGGSDVAGPPAEAILRHVKAPAMGLLATAIVNWIVVLMFIPLALHLFRIARPGLLNPMWLSFAVAASWLILLTTLITVGALKMKRLESYGWAIAASIIAIIGGAIGLPFGIWALVVLSQPDVRAAFQRRREHARPAIAGQQPPEPAPPSAQPANWLGHLSLWTAIGGLVLPVVLVLVICLVSSTLKRNVSDIYLLLCIILGIVLELIAFGCGIVARRTALGQAGLLTSILSLLLYSGGVPAVFVAIPGGDVRPTEWRVETGEAQTPPVTTLKRFATSDPTVSKDLLVVEGDAWVANCTEPQTIPLFELPNPGVEDCTVTYRAQVRTEGLKGRAYLEMWCRVPGRGEFFSRGLDHVATASTGWSSYETPFFLKKGEKPDLVRLNLVVEGTGRVGIRNIDLRTNAKQLPASPAPQIAATEIMRKMGEKYAALSSLSASGHVVSEVAPTPGGKATSIKQTFTLNLGRPDFYRITWNNPSLPEVVRQGAAWSAGDGHKVLIAGKVGTFLNRETALAAATGVSGGVAQTVPSLFFKVDPQGLVQSLKNATLLPEETVDAVPCHVVAANQATNKMTLWIAKKDGLLKKVQLQCGKDSVPGTTQALDEVSDKSLRKLLKSMGQESTPEAVGKLRKQMAEGLKVGAGLPVTITATFEKITVNEIMVKEDFEFSVPDSTGGSADGSDATTAPKTTPPASTPSG